MTDEIKKPFDPEKRDNRKYRTDSDTVSFGYADHNYTTHQLTHCNVRIRRNVTRATEIKDDGSLGPVQTQPVSYELKGIGYGDDLAKMIAMYRKLADDLEKHDFGDDA